MKSLLVFALAAGFGIAKEPTQEDAVKQEIAKLQGEWIVVHTEKDGKKLSEAERKILGTQSGDAYLLRKAIFTHRTVQLWIQTNNGMPDKFGEPTTYTIDL